MKGQVADLDTVIVNAGQFTAQIVFVGCKLIFTALDGTQRVVAFAFWFAFLKTMGAIFERSGSIADNRIMVVVQISGRQLTVLRRSLVVRDQFVQQRQAALADRGGGQTIA